MIHFILFFYNKYLVVVYFDKDFIILIRLLAKTTI